MERTKETEQRYLARAGHLIARYVRETGCDWQSDPVGVCAWLAAQRSEWSRATWRTYKAAMVFFMTRNGPIEAINYLVSKDSSPCQKKTLKTSGQKMRHLPDKDLAAILAKLQATKGRYNILLGLWLSANRFLGLRPSEWSSAKLDFASNQLIICNAKNTNGRALGEQRTLLLHELSPQELEILGMFWEKLQQSQADKEFINVYFGCKVRLFNICRRIWPDRLRYPTLYSSRHQFSADLKASGCEPKEIAAIFGHATDLTAARHYGMRTHGKNSGGGGRVIAPAEKIAQVKERLIPFTPRESPREAE